MIIDVHTHIFSGDLCRDRSGGLGDGQFSSIYGSEKSKLIDHRGLMAAMEDAGVDYAVALGFSWEKEDLCAAQNEYLRTAMDQSGGAIIPFGSIPVRPGVDVGRWAREIREMGLRGIGEVAWYRHGLGRWGLDYLRELLGAAGACSLPLCIHVNEPVGHPYNGKYEPNLRDLYAALSEFPDVDVILSHWGGGMIFYELMPEVSKALSRCRYDTAASPFIYTNDIYGIARQITDPRKILFGSDYPLIPYRRYLEAIDCGISDEEIKADILGRNAARLLKIL
ncbi:MAG: amidohydrolase family protein [Spirochaetes bacterium]|nr:amidohydrolase family protein [Spirochaetota bacterium]